MPQILDKRLNEYVGAPLVMPERKEEAPTWSETWNAAVGQENDVYNAYKLMTAPRFKDQEDFDLVKSARERGVDPRDYTEVFSDEQLDYMISKRQQEEKNRQVLDASGWAGTLAQVASGTLSPTAFIPFVRGYTGLKSIGLGAASVFGGAAAQEAILYGQQETRTMGEVAFSLGASTVIGGVLGALGHTLSKSVVDKVARDMYNLPGEKYVSEPRDLSAKENETLFDAGQLKNGAGARMLAPLSPITRGFQQWNAPAYLREMGGSSQLRKMTAGFSQASLTLEENRKWLAASPGGNVEDLKKTYAAISYAGSKLVEDAYIEYILGTQVSGFLKKQRAILAGYRADGKLDYNAFKRQIALDIWSNFTREGTDPLVRKVAQQIDQKVYKKLYDEGVEVGIFTGEEKTVGDQNYANRVYNNEVISRRHEEFVAILARNYEKQLKEQYSKGFEKLRERMIKDKAFLDDVNRPLEEIKKLQEEIKLARDQAESDVKLETIEAISKVKSIKEEVKGLKAELESLQKTKIEGADIEGFRRRKDRMDEIEAALKAKALDQENLQKTFGEDMDRYTKAISDIRKRLLNLNKSHALQDQKLQAKLDKIVKNEERQIDTILRAQKQLMKFIKMLDSASDDKLDAWLKKYRDEFHKNAKKFDETEAKLIELETGEAPPPKPKDEPPPAEGGPAPDEPPPPLDEPSPPKADEPDSGVLQLGGNKTVTAGDLPELNKVLDDLEIEDAQFEIVDDGPVFPDKPKEKPVNYKRDPNLKLAANYFRTVDDALDWIVEHTQDKYFRVIAKRLKGTLDNANFHVLRDWEANQKKLAGLRKHSTDDNLAFYVQIRALSDKEGLLKPRRAMLVKEESLDETTLLHELIHAAVNTRIYFGNAFVNRNTRYGKLVRELGELRDHLTKELKKRQLMNKAAKDIGQPPKYQITNYETLASTDIYEMMTYGLTEPVVREYLRSVKYKGKSLYGKFVTIMRELLGIPKEEESAFTHLLDLTDRFLKEPNPIPGRMYEIEPSKRITPNDLQTIIIDKEASTETALETAAEGIEEATSIDGRPPEMKLADRMDDLAAKMDDLAEKIEDLDQFDRTAFRAEVHDMMRELADIHAQINAKRAVRNEKLWKQVENLSPEERAKRIEAYRLKAADRPKEFGDRWREKGAEGDVLGGNVDFAKHAEELARQTVTKIQGSERRLAYSDIIQAERGPELARVLNIPSEEIADFLETDIERMIGIYTRTVGSDISIARVFGTADAAEEFKKLNDERQAMLKQVTGLKNKKGEPLPKEEIEELQDKTNKFYDNAIKDLQVLLERAKGIRGLPRDPDSYAARGAKMAMDLNFLRLMGGVVVNSVADLARPVMRYGLTRTMRDGFFPMVRAFKTIRMSQREAKLAGTALDVVMHQRAMAMMDIFDDAMRGSRVERGLHYLSTRMGTVALFDQWTSAMKQFTAGVANAKLLDSMAIVMGETKASAKQVTKAQEFLARNNLDAELVTTIWQQVTNGKGGGKVNGIWLPNTEDWDVSDPMVARARRAYRAALAGEVDATIITPGFERPNWVDSSVPARMLAQFKSFGFTSTQKTLMAGMQEHDAAFFNGAMLSLALGTVSYYLWATATGGDAEKKMRQALADFDGEGWKVFADEAIERSGLTGVFSEVNKFAHRVPMLRDYTTFSGQQSTRRAGGDLSEQALGPTFDLMEKAFGMAVGADEPTKGTLHMFRQMLPFQNLFYFRRLLDQVEEAAGENLPERRTGR